MYFGWRKHPKHARINRREIFHIHSCMRELPQSNLARARPDETNAATPFISITRDHCTGIFHLIFLMLKNGVPVPGCRISRCEWRSGFRASMEFDYFSSGRTPVGQRFEPCCELGEWG